MIGHKLIWLSFQLKLLSFDSSVLKGNILGILKKGQKMTGNKRERENVTSNFHSL